MSYQPLVDVVRGGVTESVHHGALAVVDAEGRLLGAIGDPDLPVFLRSCAKPFQALPLMEKGAVESFGLSPQDLAIMCSSHDGTDEHVAAVESLQAKLGIEESDLQCGAHLPYDHAAALALESTGTAPRTNHHNCSGKHSGMLALAHALGQPPGEYLAPGGPAQQAIRRALAEMAGVEPGPVITATDGCSAPTFALGLRQAAAAFARFAGPERQSETRRQAINHLYDAMTMHPRLVGGANALDTAMMAIGGSAWVAKRGAEGVIALAIRGADGQPARGVVIKIADGDGKGRALPHVAMQVLTELGLLISDQLESLQAAWPRIQVNHAGQPVGEIRARPLNLTGL